MALHQLTDTMMVELPEQTHVLFAELGCQVSPDLLITALTHSSFSNENPGVANYERLEFLGDAVLEFVVTETLFRQHPDFSEGQMARIRAATVSEDSLADIARNRLHIQPFLLLGKGELDDDGAEKSSILCDVVESLIGAVFTQYGVDQARRTVHRLVDAKLAEKTQAGPALDWKTSLTVKAHEMGLGDVSYRMEVSGPANQPVFIARAYVGDGDEPLGVAKGSSKRKAQLAAAEIAWKKLDQEQKAAEKAAEKAAA